MFYSQSGQDKWICEIFKNKKNGYFIDIGAYDGIQTSNTYMLEKELEWSGICIEANPRVFKSLEKNRSSKNINVAVTTYRGYCPFENDKIGYNNQFGDIVECDTLNSILEESNASAEIDYLSIDIEGEEFSALQSLDFSKWKIKAMTVEHNLYMCGSEQKDKIFNLLSSNGFTRIVDNAVCLDKNPLWYNKPYEDWYINTNLFKD